MKKLLSTILGCAAAAMFYTGCAHHSGDDGTSHAPTGAPMEKPMRSSGNSTGGTGGPR